MNLEKAKEATMGILLQSFIYYLNEVLSEDFSKQELEYIANTVFNVMTNSLDPESSYYWNECIFGNVKKSVQDIFNDIGWKDD
ncbi:MAG: hypothetical protein ACOC3V_05210 [bacterium]